MEEPRQHGVDVLRRVNQTVIDALSGAAAAEGASAVAGLVGKRMEQVERELILETLHHTLGNRTHAATILGISIRALRNKLRDYSAQGIPVPPPTAGVAA